jgi:hypoxia up-regulated 1
MAPVVTYDTQIASADIAESAHRTVDLVQADGTRWAVEELMAMKFAYIKHLAESVANEKATDVVVAISPYYSQLERDSFADAIEISGLCTLNMVQTVVKAPVGEYAPFKIIILLCLTRLAIRLH